MRSDMAKVIVERPRHGSRHHKAGKGYARARARYAADEQPRRESIKERSRGGSKSLNEHLGPLRRYLQRQVGRSWNKVFAEICAHISRDSAVQDHVRDHVFDYVVAQVRIVDGAPCYATGYFAGRPIEAWSGRLLLYVDPCSGILRKVKRNIRFKKRAARPRQLLFQGNGQYLVLYDGTWQWVETEPFPAQAPLLPDGERRVADVLLRRDVTRGECRDFYGRDIHAVAVRPPTKKELRPHTRNYPLPSVVT